MHNIKFPADSNYTGEKYWKYNKRPIRIIQCVSVRPYVCVDLVLLVHSNSGKYK